MQRDGRLASARCALHDSYSAVFGADDLILLRRDRLYDVLHIWGACSVDCVEQRLFFGDATSRSRPCRISGVLRIGKLFVCNVAYCAATSGDMPSRMYPVGMQGGGQVEGARQGSAPVHKEGTHLLVVIVQPDAPDIAAIQLFVSRRGIFRLRVFDVDTSEHQTNFCSGIGIEALGNIPCFAVANHESLRVVDIGFKADGLEALFQSLAGVIYPGEEIVEVVLLGGDVVIGRQGGCGFPSV